MVVRGQALAAGLLAAGLILWLHTFQALGSPPFVPTVETQQSFFAWTFAMLAAPVVVLASAVLIAIRVIPSRAAGEESPTGRGFLAPLGMTLVTAIFAARVWENVEGFLVTLNDNLIPNGTPLKFEQWPFVYHHGWWVFGGVAAAAVIGIVAAAWRARPRLVPVIVGVIVVVAVVAIGGSFGFAAMSFLRLRNWAIAVSVVDLLAIRWKSGGMAAAVQIALLLVILAATWQLHASWTAMAAEMPQHVDMPWW